MGAALWNTIQSYVPLFDTSPYILQNHHFLALRWLSLHYIYYIVAVTKLFSRRRI